MESKKKKKLNLLLKLIKMSNPRFILYKYRVEEQVKNLEKIGLKVSYSYKTNREVGKILRDLPSCQNVDFSIHSKEEIVDFSKNPEKVWFFTQAEKVQELKEIMKKGIKKFVVDNRVDLERLLKAIKESKEKICLSLRMKFKEHRIGSGKYFVYGMSSKKVNKIISEIKENLFIAKIGVHIHRKSQNTSEWSIREEIEDSLDEDSLDKIEFINFGGGLPIKYRSYTTKVLKYIFQKLEETILWLREKKIESYIEPGRFIAGPAIKLETEIIQKYGNNLIINTTVYNAALDTHLTGTKMLIEEELEENTSEKGCEFYLIKGNSPTRDDIFRYKVKLPKNIGIGDKITFINAGAYNYTTDFFGYKKLKTEIKD